MKRRICRRHRVKMDLKGVLQYEHRALTELFDQHSRIVILIIYYENCFVTCLKY